MSYACSLAKNTCRAPWRQIEDKVTAFGTGVDQTVKRISRTYTVEGTPEHVKASGVRATTDFSTERFGQPVFDEPDTNGY